MIYILILFEAEQRQDFQRSVCTCEWGAVLLDITANVCDKSFDALRNRSDNLFVYLEYTTIQSCLGHLNAERTM